MKKRLKNVKGKALSLVILTILFLPGMVSNQSNLAESIHSDDTTEGLGVILNTDSTNIQDSGDVANEESLEQLVQFSGQNVSQFDVYESVLSESPTHQINIASENFSVEIPSGWDVESQSMEIGAVYESMEVISNGDFETYNENWDFYTNHPETTTKQFQFLGDFSNQDLMITARNEREGGSFLPADAIALGMQTTGKPDVGSELEIWETDKISDGREEIQLYSEFVQDPLYDENLNNPFGGETGSAYRDLAYNDFESTMDAYIQAGTSNVSLGSPSIGWSTTFNDTSRPDFVPARYEIAVVWKVESLGYEADDNLSVIVKIDGNYVNGQYDAEENPHSSATPYSIENSLASGITDHDYIIRYFDITPLMGDNKEHSLEFGIALSNIDETDDIVSVQFGALAILAYEEDQYKIGDAAFELSFDFVNEDDKDDWALVAYFQDTLTANQQIVPLDYLSDITSGTSLDDEPLSYSLTSRLKYILNSSTYILGIGILNVGGLREFDESFTVSFDNIMVTPNYRLANFRDVGLQRWSGTEWVDQSSTIMTSTNPVVGNYLQYRFNATNSYLSNPIMSFRSNITFSRLRPGAAEASYTTPEVNIFGILPIRYIYWNVTYNNTETINEFVLDSYENVDPIGYNFTFVDIPAYDGLGSDTKDWELLLGLDPLGHIPYYASSELTNGTGNSGNYQNNTIADATQDYWGGVINGTWLLFYRALNSLSSIALQHDDGDPSPKFYDGDGANIIVSQNTTADVQGSYGVSFYNSTGSLVTGFPDYYPDESGKLNQSWSVLDEGVGQYPMVAIWNNSHSSSPEVTRVGIVVSGFNVWRHTQASLTGWPPGLPSGSMGEFDFTFSELSGNPIDSVTGYVRMYDNDTGSLWGRDYPPYRYLVESVTEDLASSETFGNYTLEFGTEAIPTGSYNAKILIQKPFYDAQILEWIIVITGTPLTMELLSGATNITAYNGYVHGDNLPYVNASDRSTIQVYLKNPSNGQPIQGGEISGTFSDSELIFTGTELYQQSGEPADFGIYDIEIDGEGLNSTNEPGINNYTLTLTGAAEGYNSTYVELSTEVLPILTDIDANPVCCMYEGGEFEFYANFNNILDSQNPLPLTEGAITWSINNTLANGNFSRVLGNVYKAEIDLETINYYISPGNYTFIVNATQFNCANASWVQTNLEIISKESTQLGLKISENLQIGTTFNVQANLTYVNSTAIANAEIRLIITYSGVDPITIVKTTDSSGLATHSQIIPTTYANKNLTVEVSYAGDELAHPSSNLIANRTIKGKNPADILLNHPTDLRVGYENNITGTLHIDTVSSYSNIFITVAAWYDGDGQNLQFIQQIYCEEDGSFDYLAPAIDEGYNTLTFFVDYAGTTINQYTSNSSGEIVINPKWVTNVTINNVDTTIRNGQTISFYLNASFDDLAAIETLLGEELEVRIENARELKVYSGVLNDNYSIEIEYEIPLLSTDWLNITAFYLGTDRIAGFQETFSYSILPQIQPKIVILDDPLKEEFTGDFHFRVQLLDSDDNPIPEQDVVFLVHNLDDDTFVILTAPTNENGTAEITITFNTVGNYEIEPTFYTSGIYAEVTVASSNSSPYSVRVINYRIMVMDNIVTIGIVLGSAIILSASIYRGVVVPTRNKRRKALVELLRRFGDVENIQYLLIIHKETGVNMYSQTFSDIPIDETLISGFLSAITSFGEEIGSKVAGDASAAIENLSPGDVKTTSRGGLEELAYRQFKIVMIEGEFVRTAVLLLKSASPSLKERIKLFNKNFETLYLDILDNWSGQLPEEEPIVQLVEKDLYADLLYTHNVVGAKVPNYMKNLKKKSTSALILKAATDQYDNSFKVRDMIVSLAGHGKGDVQTFKAINELRKDQIVFAVNPRTDELIQQFKPYIDELSKDERTVLVVIAGGALSTKKIERVTGMMSVIPILAKLHNKQLIKEDNTLTEQGEILATMINLIPEF